MASGLSHGTRRDVSIESMARPVAVDHRISIHYYFRIADNLLRQANVYREEKNVIDLYIILLRYSSLLLETIPKHRDYNAFKAREKDFLKKGPHNSEKILGVVNELESLKPVVQQQIATLNSRGADEPNCVYGTYVASSGLEHHTPGPYMSKSMAGSPTLLLQKPLPDSKHQAAASQSIQPYRHAMKPPTNMLYPKEETLSRHSILGPNGLQGNLGQWTRPVTGIRVVFTSRTSLAVAWFGSRILSAEY